MRKLAEDDEWEDDVWPEDEQAAAPSPVEAAPVGAGQPTEPNALGGTGHPAVDAVLQSLANAARLAPADQIAEYEAVHRVLQETLATIDR